MKELSASMIAHAAYGNPFDLEKIKKNWLMIITYYLIEDCCDALGSKYNNKNVGTFGDVCNTIIFIPPITLLQEKAVEFLVILQKLKEFWSLLETGVEIVGAIQVGIILAKDLTGILKNMPKGYDHKYTKYKNDLNNKFVKRFNGSSWISTNKEGKRIS